MMMAHDDDPRDDILAKVGSLDNVEVFHNQILVATYVRPKKTKSGIYLSDQTVKEDEYQGKVGLVLKVGPQAFVSDDKSDFHGLEVAPGDWIFYRPSDGWPTTVNGVPCRMFDNEYLIRGRVSSPDAVW